MENKQLSKQQKKHIEKHVEEHVEKHVDETISKKLLTKADFFKHQFKQHVSTAIIAAFSFLIALTWKDLIVDFTNSFIKEDIISKAPYLPSLISTFIVTLIAVIGILTVTAWAKKPHVLINEYSTD